MRAPSRTNTKRRILVLFLVCGIFFLILAVRLGWIMLVDGEEYSAKAVAQQTRDTPLTAERGSIYDTNMKELAVNAPAYTVWVRPGEVKDKKGDPAEMAAIIAEIIQGDPAVIQEEITRNSALVRIAKNIPTDQAKKIRENMQERKLPGISVDENSIRYYPYGSFASTLIGHTTDDGNGITGLELSYNNYLSGKSGRIIRNTDASGRQLAYGTEKYFEPADGLNLVLTIDEVLQHYLEKALENACTGTLAKRAMAIVMVPDTGDILAMGIYPSYDLNSPRVPIRESDLEEYNALESNEDKVNYWNKMWRNFLVSDTYEPGSTFKLITTAIALEEGLTKPEETFCCTGSINVYTDTLKCWRSSNPHGVEDLATAVQNSCNPVFVTLGLRIGARKYFQYLDSMGITGKTGIDLNGEATAITYGRKTIRPTELATMSYGQGISVTPIQLITALSSIVNGGFLMQPHVVKEIVNDEGEVIFRNDPTVLRRTFSEQTSEEMKVIMQSVVEKGTGSGAYIPGYKIGGKTGTADKVVNGRYAAGRVYSSFACAAPIDDPEIAVLFIVDEPVGVHYASTVVVPYVRDFLEEALVYMQVEPKYTESESGTANVGPITVQSLTGHTVAEAERMLSKQGLKVKVMPESAAGSELKVIDQYPKYLTRVEEGATVYIYTE